MISLKTTVNNFKFQNDSITHSAMASLGCFILLCIGVVFKTQWMTQWDQIVYHTLVSLRSPAATQFFLFLNAFKVEEFYLFFIVVSILLILNQEKWRALHWIGIGILTLVITDLLKYMLFITRPQGFVIFPDTGSFPSAHVIINTVFLRMFLTICHLGKKMNPVLRISNYKIHSIWVSLIFLSRLYLAAHWFSDVLGGLLISVFLLSAFHIVYARQAVPAIKNRSQIVFIALGMLMMTALADFLWEYHW